LHFQGFPEINEQTSESENKCEKRRVNKENANRFANLVKRCLLTFIETLGFFLALHPISV